MNVYIILLLLYEAIVFGVLCASVGTEDMSRSRRAYRGRTASCVQYTTYLYNILYGYA